MVWKGRPWAGNRYSDKEKFCNEFKGDCGTKSKPIPGPHLVYHFLTTAPNVIVEPIHPTKFDRMFSLKLSALCTVVADFVALREAARAKKLSLADTPVEPLGESTISIELFA